MARLLINFHDDMADVEETFFSGKYWYASSTQKGLGRSRSKPFAVGCGATEEEAIADMRIILMGIAESKKKDQP
jgi:hypothetical protein